ncbi:methyl-accepting chemotaxis protein [Hydrogenispora ethanolica]|uniref:Methyl-accepting chemotaxis protein n=1 Tax=Hydrogenispora ethanolica TaxID=1082276 RepID=A0A4R1S3J5_HYDET|nr:methyl-accepting chemotaxis protein [Hydrogenispora ethanolica]TCL73200.1 methyl-accepting chemotaxis protein [Hydrogenispora ethanolica]
MLPKKIASSLFLKTMLLLNAFVIIPALVIFVFVNLIVTSSIKEEIQKNLAMVTSEKQSKLNYQLTNMENLAQTLANDPFAKEYFLALKQGRADAAKRRQLATFLEGEVQKGQGLYENMLYYYDGKAAVDGIGGKSDNKTTDQKTTQFGVVRVSPTTGRPVMVNYIAVSGNDFQTLYVFTMAIELGKVAEQIIANGQEQTVKTMIVNGQGLIIASETADQIMKLNLNEAGAETARFFRNMSIRDSGVDFLTMDGRKYLAAYAKDAARDLYLISYTPISQYTQKSNQLALGFLILLGISVVAGLLISYFATRRMLIQPLQRLTAATERMALGDCDIQLDIRSKDEIGVLANSFTVMVDNIREGARAAERIAAGDLGLQLEVRSDRDLLNTNLNEMIRNIQSVIADINMLSEAAIAGQLSVRADAEKHQGDFQTIVAGINQTLDAVIDPLHVAADYIERIGRGEIPEQLEAEYQGDFNNLKNSINACIEGLGALTESNAVLQRMAQNDYTQKIEGNYQGVYDEIAQATNGVIDRLNNLQRVTANMADGDFGDLEELRQVGRRSENDRLMPSLIHLMETVLEMVQESVRLSEAATAGQLDSRGDIRKFAGEYRRVIEGFNATLDAVVAPLTEAEAVLGKIAVNDYTQEMKGEYQGVLREFAAQINTTRTRLLSVQDVFVRLAQGDISRLEEFRRVGRRSENDRMMPSATAMMEAIDALIGETNMLAGAAASGELKARGDAAKFSGKYQEIVIGLNSALDAMAHPIAEASAVLDEMARGSLESLMAGEYQGEYARIKESLNRAIDSFNQVLGEIHIAANQVAAASRQVSSGSQSMSQGATEQAATVEELSASIAEIAAQTKQNALRAGQANELANLTKDNAIQGNAQMEQMVAAMTGINEASTNISKIIKVIDEIAFQTNILALNAAVEAARAGQHGKGFAVVAEEVRNLAGRSAKAAKETTELIEGSLRKVAEGTQIAGNTAESLDKIVTAVTQAADLVSEIAVASNEQATGIAQINQGINQVSQVTQTNTATSEESASASEELSSQAEHLKEMVGRFRLKGGARTEQAAESDSRPAPKARSKKPDLAGSSEFGKY